MEYKKYSINDISDIHYRMHCGIRAIGAIHELLENGVNTPEDYTDALYGVYDYLGMLNGELSEVIDGFPMEKAKEGGDMNNVD